MSRPVSQAYLRQVVPQLFREMQLHPPGIMQIPKHYVPPKGSQAIPHPRSVVDLLLRTLALHLFAAIAYSHFLSYFLPPPPSSASAKAEAREAPVSLSIRLRQLVAQHAPQLALSVVLAAFPELLAVQLAALVLFLLVSPSSRDRLVKRLQTYMRATQRPGQSPAVWALKRLAFALFNAIPLAAGLRGYRDRLHMRYHQADYVGNLGLDHRNGWLVAASLVAVAVTFVLVITAVMLPSGLGPERHAAVNSDYAKPRSDLPYDEKEVCDVAAKPQSSFAPSLSLPNSITGSTGFLYAITVLRAALAELMISALIQQFLLSRTNHATVFRLLASARARYFLFLAFLVCSGLGLAMLRARRLRRTVNIPRLASSVAAVVLLVAIVVPLYGDFHELWQVSHGIVERYNYRWAMRDSFSAYQKLD